MAKDSVKRMKLIQLNLNKDGAYFMYQLEVTRGIRGNTKGKVDEVIIFGVPYDNLHRYCIEQHIFITNKAVYENDWDHPILWSKDGVNYDTQRI